MEKKSESTTPAADGNLPDPDAMESWTAKDYEAFQAALPKMLKAMPAGTIIQKTDVYYDRPYREEAPA